MSIGCADPFEKLDRVNFELSNRCNLSHLHPRCPAHLEAARPPENLSSAVVFQVLDDLRDAGFAGCISFHQYGEPLMDPRLLWFLERVNRTVPRAKTLIWTNGTTLDEHLIRDLRSVGLNHLAVTAYGAEELERLRSLDTRPDFMTIYDSNWVEVFGIYDAAPVHLTTPCYAPLTDLIVTRTGHVGLCCRDWERRHTFGDLNIFRFRKVLESPEIRAVYDRLSHGDRYLDICQRCLTTRDWRGARGKTLRMRGSH
jgi:hypothetical protein